MQGGELIRVVAEQLLQQAQGDYQIVFGFDHAGLRQITSGGGLVDVGDGAVAQIEAAFGSRYLLLESLELGARKVDGLARQQHIEVAAGQAYGNALRLGIEYRFAIAGALLALAVLDHFLAVIQRLTQLQAEVFRVVVQIVLDAPAKCILLLLGAVDLAFAGPGSDLRQ